MKTASKSVQQIIADKIAALAIRTSNTVNQSIFAFQGKNEMQVLLKNFLEDNFIVSVEDINKVFDELLKDPFVGYEPIMQVVYNNSKIQSLVEHRKQMLNVR